MGYGKNIGKNKTNNMKQDPLEGIFELLLKNKEFPNYHAERRIDIFINYFIERILSSYLSKDVKFICPEFPIKKETSNLSTKLDYLCTTNDEIIFVELKTDDSSFKEQQADIYLNCEWEKCLKDLEAIMSAVKKKSHKLKYEVLNNTITSLKFKTTPSIRIIYLSPPINIARLKKFTTKKIVELATLLVSHTENETTMWNFIKDLNLSIFEITK